MTETKHVGLDAVTTEHPSPITADEMIKVLRSLCEAAGMIGNHVAAIHLEAWRAIDDLTSKSLLPNLSEGESQVSKDDLSGLLTPVEVAEILGICRATLHKMRKNGRFPQPIFMSARKLRYRRADVMEWLDRQASLDRPAGSEATNVAL